MGLTCCRQDSAVSTVSTSSPHRRYLYEVVFVGANVPGVYSCGTFGNWLEAKKFYNQTVSTDPACAARLFPMLKKHVTQGNYYIAGPVRVK